MENRRKKVAERLEDVWSELLPDFSTPAELHNYHLDLQVGKWLILLDIVSSPGGGFEGGYGSTGIKAQLPATSGFEFVVYPDDFLNKIGKLFGMEDVVLGYKELDDQLIVKTNNKEGLSKVFADTDVRNVFANLSGFSLKLENDDDEGTTLDLSIQRAVSDYSEFKEIFGAYFRILNAL